MCGPTLHIKTVDGGSVIYVTYTVIRTLQKEELNPKCLIYSENFLNWNSSNMILHKLCRFEFLNDYMVFGVCIWVVHSTSVSPKVWERLREWLI